MLTVHRIMMIILSAVCIAVPSAWAADPYHDPQFLAEKGDPGCKGEETCGASPQWLKGAAERVSKGNELRLSVSRNAAQHPTASNYAIATKAVDYLKAGNDPFLFGLWLAKYNSTLLAGPDCTLEFL